MEERSELKKGEIELIKKALLHVLQEKDFRKFVEGAMTFARLFVPNPRDLTEEDVLSIYEEAY